VKSEPFWDEQTQLLNKYATAATLLYGVLSLGEFVELVNHYEKTGYRVTQVAKMLKPCLDDDNTWYALDAGLLIGPALGAQTGDWVVEQVEDIRLAQAGKPRYLPSSKKVLLSYIDEDYHVSGDSYNALKKYLESKPIKTYESPLNFVEDALDWIKFEICDQTPMREILNQMTDAGLSFENEADLEHFLSLMTEVWNNTRLFENNGFTATEMYNSGIFARG